MDTPGAPHTEAVGYLTWLKDLSLPALTGVAGIVLTYLRFRYERKTAQFEEELHAQERKDAVRVAQDKLNNDQSDGITLRFMTLMDGYERRIKDLIEEVTGLRGEVRGLRAALDERTRMCSSCPVFQAIQKRPDAPAAPTATG
jgi:hypothetical protein